MGTSSSHAASDGNQSGPGVKYIEVNSTLSGLPAVKSIKQTQGYGIYGNLYPPSITITYEVVSRNPEINGIVSNVDYQVTYSVQSNIPPTTSDLYNSYLADAQRIIDSFRILNSSGTEH